MNIGKAAEASGVSAKMIRYYEAVDLIPAPGRTQSGYRDYSDRDVHTLRFIQRARSLGFTVEQMRNLLSLWQDRHRASADVRKVAVQHIVELERKIEELQQMRNTLAHLSKHCHNDGRPDCPILEELAQTPGSDS